MFRCTLLIEVRDVNFTQPYQCVSISRHARYEWAVLVVTVEDPSTFYEPTSNLTLVKPCSHPDAITCGITGNNNTYV